MSDEYLLELAARARGGVKYFNGAFRSAETGYREWNPLEDDADAFRLAMQLNLSIIIKKDLSGDFAYVVCGFFPEQGLAQEYTGVHDKSSLVRRAIVRAAAQLTSSS